MSEKRPELEQFASLLRMVMANRGVQVTDLAETLDVSPTTVSHWRGGRAEPSPNNVRALSMALGHTAVDFFRALAGEAVDPPEPTDTAPMWARDAGDLKQSTVQAIRMLIDADKASRQRD